MPSPILKKLSAAIRGSYHVQPPTIPSPTDYVAYWTMDDAQVSGATLLDVSGNDHTATMINTPTTGVDGQKAEAVQFNGTNQYATVVDHADLKPTAEVTVSAWVYSDNLVDEDLIFQSYSALTNRSGVRLHLKPTGEVNFTIAKNTGSVLDTDFKNATSSSQIKDGRKHLVAVTFDGSEMKVYVDGSLESVVPFSATIGYEATNYVRIGSHSTTGVELWHFNGTIDDIKLFTRAISAEEVRAMFLEDGGFVPAPQDYIARWELETAPTIAPPTDFVAEWTMDDVVGSLLNETNNAHDATLVNAPTFPAGFDGNAMLLNGTTQCATVVDNVALRPSEITACAWVNGDSVSNAIFSVWSVDGSSIRYGYRIYLDGSGRMALEIADGVGVTQNTNWVVAFGTTNLTDGKWHHVAATFDGDVLSIYVDGGLETAKSFTLTIGYGTQFLLIGARETSVVREHYFSGSIDRLQLFNYAATPAQIKALARIAPDSTFRGHQGRIDGLPISVEGNGYDGGNALTLDSVDDKVVIQNHADLRPTLVSVSAWAKLKTGYNSYGEIFSSWHNDGTTKAGLSLAVDATKKGTIQTGKDTGNVLGTDHEVTSTSALSENVWVHLVGTYDGAAQRLYVNGIFEISEAWAVGLAYDSVNNSVRMGSRVDLAAEGGFFDGDLDDIRLYGRTITPAEIRAIFDARVPAPPSDFVAEWTMDDVAGAVLNETLNNHDATLVNTPTFAPGYEGDAMTLNGVDQRATIVDHADLKPANITAAARVRLAIADTGDLIFSSYNQDPNIAGFNLRVSSGVPHLTIGDNTGVTGGVNSEFATGTTNIDDGEYHHVVGTYDGEVIKLYIDGILEGVTQWANGIVYNPVTNNVRIGCRKTSAGEVNFFNGDIDKTQFFNRAVSPEEVAAMAGVIYTPPAAVVITLTPANILDTVPNGPYTTATVVSLVEGGVGPFTYSWVRISGSTITADTPLAADTSFSGNRTDAESLETFELTVTDQGNFDSTHTKQIAVNIIWGTPP